MTTLKPKITIRKNPGGSRSFCVDAGMIDGQRHRRFFNNAAEARGYAGRMQEARKKQGDLAFSLTPPQQVEAGKAFERLTQYNGITLSAVIDYYVKHAQPSGGKKLLNDAVLEFLAIKTKAGKKPRYIRELRSKFNNFNKAFGSKFVNEISHLEIEEWLSRQPFEPATQVNYLRDLGIFFRWACDSRKYCAEKIILRIQKPQVQPSETKIFQVSEALALLFAAHVRPELELVPYIAIGLFAGLRTSELQKLDWSKINLREKKIEVTAASAKTSQHRLVDISENLAAWLQAHEELEGAIAPKNVERRIKSLLKMAEINEWPKNGMRHSFGSYHYAQRDNANLTASQLGHENTNMLFKHYRARRSREEALQYWEIMPPKGWAMLHITEQTKRAALTDAETVEKAKKALQQVLSDLDKKTVGIESVAA